VHNEDPSSVTIRGGWRGLGGDPRGTVRGRPRCETVELGRERSRRRRPRRLGNRRSRESEARVVEGYASRVKYSLLESREDGAISSPRRFGAVDVDVVEHLKYCNVRFRLVKDMPDELGGSIGLRPRRVGLVIEPEFIRVHLGVRELAVRRCEESTVRWLEHRRHGVTIGRTAPRARLAAPTWTRAVPGPGPPTPPVMPPRSACDAVRAGYPPVPRSSSVTAATTSVTTTSRPVVASSRLVRCPVAWARVAGEVSLIAPATCRKPARAPSTCSRS